MLQDYSLKDVTKTVFYLSNKSINLQRAFWLVVQNCLLKAGLKGTALRRDGGNSLQPPHDAVSLSIEQKKVCLINKSLNFNRLGIEVSCCLFWHKEMSSRPAVKLSNITNWNKFSDLCSYFQSVCSARLPLTFEQTTKKCCNHIHDPQKMNPNDSANPEFLCPPQCTSFFGCML